MGAIAVNADQAGIVELPGRLLDAVTSADRPAHTELCGEDLTAFEPEAVQHLVVDMPFHQHCFGRWQHLHRSGARKRASTRPAPTLRPSRKLHYGEARISFRS